jgi:hypothetical protein
MPRASLSRRFARAHHNCPILARLQRGHDYVRHRYADEIPTLWHGAGMEGSFRAPVQHRRVVEAHPLAGSLS